MSLDPGHVGVRFDDFDDDWIDADEDAPTLEVLVTGSCVGQRVAMPRRRVEHPVCHQIEYRGGRREQLVTRAGATRMVDEIGEQLELLRSEGDKFTVDPDLARPDVHLHADSLGHKGTLGPGGVQWMTAGSGIVHEEFHSDRFTSDGGVLEMAQLWVNLPASDKSTPPKYQDLRDEQFPRAKLADDNGDVRVIAGDFDGTRGPASTFTPINIWDIRVNAGRTAQLTVPAGHTCVLIVQLGTLTANNSPVKSMEVVQFERDGSLIELKTETASRVLLLSGKPLAEPVVGQGPFVMNTRQEIQ